MQVVELVVFRHAQLFAKLHFHRSLAPANSRVSPLEGTAASVRL
jgi:hypothetical protein